MKKKISAVKIFVILFMSLSSIRVQAQNDLKQGNDSLLTICKKFYNEGLYRNAIDVYKETAFEKLSAEESFYLGLSFNNFRGILKAAQYFKRAVDLAPAHNGYKLNLARTHSQLGKTNEAVSNYEMILESDSNNVAALYEVGLIYFDKREYAKTIKIFDRLVMLNNNDFLSNYYLGYAMLLSPNPLLAEKAMNYLQRAVSFNSEYVPAVSLLASQNFSLQKYYQANSLYSIARKLRPENADFNYRSGMCYERLKLFQEATNLYSKACELDSNDANYFDHLGFSFFNLAKYDSAASAYKTAATLDDNPTYYVNLGFAYARMDSVTKSVESFQKAVQLLRLDKIGYIYNQIGAVHYSKQNLKPAKAAYEKSLVYNPGNIDAQFYIAMIYEKFLDWRNASLAYRKVIELAGDDSARTERKEYSQKRIKELKRRY